MVEGTMKMSIVAPLDLLISMWPPSIVTSTGLFGVRMFVVFLVPKGSFFHALLEQTPIEEKVMRSTT